MMIPMAEGFDQYHLPQQSRRDRLRVNNNYPPLRLDNAPILPLHDPPLISSDLIHQSNFNLDGMHMIGTSSLPPTNHMYLNSIQLNPNAIGGQSLCLSLSSHNLEMNLQRYGCVLKGSRFLKPMQVLLEEICDVAKGICFGKDNEVDLSVMDSYPFMENFSGNGSEQLTRKKSRLISMLDEVYKRYKQYYQQLQTVVASFESISGLSSAAPLANMALKALCTHFRCLKSAISDQLQFMIKSNDETYYKLENSGRAAYGQRPSSGYNDHQPVWRPQRGLPERAVTVLRAWLFEHFLHPYPTDTDKIMLASQTGLSRNQVSNWFINARVRLWKPMVKEIHMLETHQGQKNSQSEEQQNDHFPTTSSYEEFPSKPNHENVTQTPLPYDNFSHNPNDHLGVGVSNAAGVSLTLGLHQNSVGLSEPYPINAARHFGLETEQNGQFGRDIIGQLSQDFVW